MQFKGTAERPCESLDETFFNGQCLPIGSTEHCPSGNMKLVDGQDNKGFCDCLDIKGENGLNIIFSQQTGWAMLFTKYSGSNI